MKDDEGRNGELDLKPSVDEAIDRVGENAGAQWGEEALNQVINYAHSSDKPFLTEDIRKWAKDFIGDPHDGRAWGHVMRQAAKMGVVKKVGYAAARSSNLTPKVLWEANRR